MSVSGLDPGSQPEQRVAHRAADETRLDAARRERVEHRPGRRLRHPRLGGDPGPIVPGLGHQRRLGFDVTGDDGPFCQRGAT